MIRLIVHFGIHRTGSTSIQQSLKANQKELISHGYLYPDIDDKSGHVALPWNLNAGRTSPDKVIEQIERQSSASIHTVILSAEDFCILNDDQFLYELSSVYELHGIVYLRRQDLWLESWYNQHVRVPWDRKYSSRSFDYFRENIEDFYWIDYQKLLGRISKLILPSRLYVNTIQRGFVENSVEDFMMHCGIDTAWMVLGSDQNRSLSSAKIDILRRMNLIDIEPEKRWKIIKLVRKMRIAGDNGVSRFFTPNQRVEIFEKFSASNTYVARHYFQRDSLFSEQVDFNALPVFVSDKEAYRKYIPLLLKEVAST